jgi:hypothetical protein
MSVMKQHMFWAIIACAALAMTILLPAFAAKRLAEGFWYHR